MPLQLGILGRAYDLALPNPSTCMREQRSPACWHVKQRESSDSHGDPTDSNSYNN